MSAQTSGYSGTPLAKKLGIVASCRVAPLHAPSDYVQLIEPVPSGVVFENLVSQDTDIVHVFAHRKAVLRAELESLRSSIKSNGVIWVS